MALAFGLMSLATAIVGMVVVSDKQAKAAAQDVVTRTTLESAIEAGLFGLERNGAPEAAEWTDRQTLNGEDVELTFEPVRYKPDINRSGPADVTAAIADPGLRDRISAALTPALAPIDANSASNAANATDATAVAFGRFSDFVQAVGANAPEEDCLRRRLTIGRMIGSADPAPPVTGFIPTLQPLQAGAVIDVRAEARDAVGRREVLWRRVRYVAKPERPWLTHDWRELRLGRTDTPCPLPASSLSLGGNSVAP
ncbi:MAG TPA: hypothetical protein VGI95_02500 [Caulobacteraceae bacterium]|jgi:hypothetical protein